jgi:hypothetical protein
LPTLDTPIPKGKSAMWCASFQLAWERLKTEITKGPVKLLGAEATAQRLNDAPSAGDTVNQEDYYAGAGFYRDGIVTEIRQEMTKRYPGVPMPDVQATPDGAVAYAYLKAAVQFTSPFLENDRPLTFDARDGTSKRVCSFGLPSGINVTRRSSLAKQVEILHSSANEGYQIEIFVVDLCKDTSPYQVLVARIPQQPTLAAMLADMNKRIAGPNNRELTRPLRLIDSLAIPHLRFRINYRFKELEGREISGTGLLLTRAIQQIDFRLDAAGARLTSQSRIEMKADPRGFYADRPFVVVLQKRGEKQPFFMLSVENGELLEAWGLSQNQAEKGERNGQKRFKYLD